MHCISIVSELRNKIDEGTDNVDDAGHTDVALGGGGGGGGGGGAGAGAGAGATVAGGQAPTVAAATAAATKRKAIGPPTSRFNLGMLRTITKDSNEAASWIAENLGSHIGDNNAVISHHTVPCDGSEADPNADVPSFAAADD